MLMKTQLGGIFKRANEIYRNEGLVPLLKSIFASLISFENSTYYIYEVVLEHENEANVAPKIQNISFKVVETTQQLDELLKDGFDLSLLNITKARYRLQKGAVLALIFVERELGWQNWSATTEEAKNTFNNYPYKVDFANNEACRGGVWTNPKYRR